MEPAVVLVIDNDAQTRAVLERVLVRDRMLRYLRPQVITAADGEKGLSAFHQHKPALVIVDLVLPRIDGFRLIDQIRATPEGRSIPIIATSAILRGSQELRRLEVEHRVVFLPKPFSILQMVEQVRRALPRPDSATPPAKVDRSATVQAPGSAKATPLARQLHASASPAVGIPASPARRDLLARSVAAPPAPTTAATGDLGSAPLPRLLLDAAEQQWTGTLTLARGKLRAELGD